MGILSLLLRFLGKNSIQVVLLVADSFILIGFLLLFYRVFQQGKQWKKKE